MKKVIFALTVVFMAGCGTIHEQYVEADRATLEALKPKLVPLMEQDKKVDNLVKSWEARIEAAEAGEEE